MSRFKVVRSLVVLGTALSGVAAVRAAIPITYYDSISTSSASTCRSTMNTVISANSNEPSYSSTYDYLIRTDEDPANSSNVILLYSEASRAKSLGVNPLDNNNPSTGGWNKEHTWPQSFFNQAQPMRGDLHALFPCDVDSNSDRSNRAYAVVTNPTNTSSQVYPDVFGNRLDTNNGLWEPCDASKGRAARAILFMDVRYPGKAGEPDLVVTDLTSGTLGTGLNRMANLTTLLAWHRQFKPTAFERVRNDRVYKEQRNGNPFVDRPELAALIFGGTAWNVTNGDTLTVASTNRAPGTTQSPGAANVPLLSLNVTLSTNTEYHIRQVNVTKLGTILDSEVSNVRLWWDVNNDGQAVSGTDTLLDTRTLSAGATAFDLTNYPFYVAQGTMNLLITANVASSVSGSKTLGVQVDANGILPSTRGGNDATPTFSNQSSNLVTIGSSVSNGDTLSVGSTNRAPLNVLTGATAIPMLSLALTPSGNEWDLASVSVSRLGTATDADVPTAQLYLDSGSTIGSLDGGDTLLDAEAFSSGAVTFTPASALRLTGATTRNFLIVADIASGATAARTVGIRANANGILSSTSGGTDTNPTFANQDSNLSTIFAPASGGNGLDLIISEVFEGSAASLKYVELYNQTTSTQFLSIASGGSRNLALRRYANGSLSATSINLSGSIPAGGYYVIANNATDFDAVFSSSLRNATSGNISHNGNDAYDLFDSTNNVVLDGFASDLLGTSTNFAVDIVAMRVLDELPNAGDWGGATQPASGANSPSGYWSTRTITSGNGNAATVGNPGSVGVPVSVVGFEVE